MICILSGETGENPVRARRREVLLCLGSLKISFYHAEILLISATK